MKLRFEGAALGGVSEDLGGEATALRRVGDQLMDDVVGVDRRDAELVEVSRRKRLAAGNPASEADFHSALGAGLTSASSVRPVLIEISRPDGVIRRPVTKMRRLRFVVCSAWLRKRRPM